MKEQEVFSKTKFILLGIMISIVGCTKKSTDELTDIFKTTKPWRQTLDVSRQYVAQIRAIQHIEIRSLEKGYLQETFVNEGQWVKKDEKLFQIMPVLMNAEYKKARAEYEVLKIEYENTKKLAQEKVVSSNELALVKAKFDKVAAELGLAKKHLDMTTIKAPFEGVIDRFRVRLGSLVEEGELLTTLSDISKLWVYFNLSEADYLTYQKNSKNNKKASQVKLLLANGEIYSLPGEIDTIEADFDNETGNIPFRATFPNPDQILRHGETGEVILTETLENVLVIPQKASFEVIDKKYVFVVTEKGEIEEKQIEIEKEVPGLFILKSGQSSLSESDSIMISGIGKVSKGMKIKTHLLNQSDVLKSLELKAE